MGQALELSRFSHDYDQITYHIVLVPKYREKYSAIIEITRIAIYIISFMKQIYKIHALEIVEDHVHLFSGIQSKQISINCSSILERR
jgi:putative transposase